MKELKRITKKLSKRDFKTLLMIYNECKKRGATPKQLAPLGDLIFVDWKYKPNAETIEAIIQSELYPETLTTIESLDDIK